MSTGISVISTLCFLPRYLPLGSRVGAHQPRVQVRLVPRRRLGQRRVVQPLDLLDQAPEPVGRLRQEVHRRLFLPVRFPLRIPATGVSATAAEWDGGRKWDGGLSGTAGLSGTGLSKWE